MKKTFPYQVIFKSNVTGSTIKMPEKSKVSAKQYVKRLKSENKKSCHNSKILTGKCFKLYKNIKIKRR